MSEFPQLLQARAQLVGEYLARSLDGEEAQGTPLRLLGAMRHAVLGGGKRFRPFLTIECAGLFGTSADQAMAAAAAIESVHCYSLIHDDLPCMDNDEVRRGMPTVWKAYDEWTAVLAGDGLQTLAFGLLSRPECHPDAGVRSELVSVLAAAAGSSGMVGGQALDLEAGRLRSGEVQLAENIARLQAMKTGRLIRAACEMGAILGRATASERQVIRSFGECLGLAFQISDDLLDAEGSAADAGKATGKDAALGKATLVSLLGIERTRARMDEIVAEAISVLAPFGSRADTLADAARFLGRRTR